MDNIALINSTIAQLQNAMRAAWPWNTYATTPLLHDTQVNRINWRETLVQAAAGQDMGAYQLPYVVIETGATKEWTGGGICNHAEILPVYVVFVTSLMPVNTTVATVTNDTEFTVASPTGIFPGQKLMLAGTPVTVLSIAGSTVILTSDPGATTVGMGLQSYDATAEINTLLEKLRDEIYIRNHLYGWNIEMKPVINSSLTSEVNMALYSANYAVQAGTLTCELQVGVAWE